jgi:hypothetical protein
MPSWRHDIKTKHPQERENSTMPWSRRMVIWSMVACLLVLFVPPQARAPAGAGWQGVSGRGQVGLREKGLYFSYPRIVYCELGSQPHPRALWFDLTLLAM